VRNIVETIEKNTIMEEDENIDDVKKTILKHYDILEELYGKEKATKDIRKHIIWYTSGLKNGKEVRVRVNEIDSKEKIEELLKIL
jgi:nifR3 family protein